MVAAMKLSGLGLSIDGLSCRYSAETAPAIQQHRFFAQLNSRLYTLTLPVACSPQGLIPVLDGNVGRRKWNSVLRQQ
jgi:hypothetical protein